MRKLLSLLLAAVLILSCGVTAYAADASREYFFELSVDGSDQKTVQTGDIITVVFTLNRTDSEENHQMYAMQNEIRYDSEFFRLVDGSAMLSDGISTTEIGLRDSFREFYMNFVSLSGGENWNAKRLIGSFQLEVIGTSGVTKITNQDYLVSTADGKDCFTATCQDVTVILSTECTVRFESNGGSLVPDLLAQYGETIEQPEDPIREGYHLVGWYTDIDQRNPWNFDTDTVQGNMTLYAKWEKGDPATIGRGSGGIWWLLILIALSALIVVVYLWMNRRTVFFETNCKMKIPEQKVRKGTFVERPAEPKREGRTFAGWFYDAECTERWDFENDKVSDNMTLYAKWI